MVRPAPLTHQQQRTQLDGRRYFYQKAEVKYSYRANKPFCISTLDTSSLYEVLHQEVEALLQE